MNKIFFILFILVLFHGPFSFAGAAKSDKILLFNKKTGSYNKVVYVTRPNASQSPAISLESAVILQKDVRVFKKATHMLLTTTIGSLLLVKKGKEVYIADGSKKHLRKISASWQAFMFSNVNDKINLLIEDNVLEGIDTEFNPDVPVI